MRTVIISSPAHTAHLDYHHGVGLLVLPNPTTDAVEPLASTWHPAVGVHFLGGSTHGQSWDEMMKKLLSLGWETCLDDFDELPLGDGYLSNGCAVVGLVGPSDLDVDLEGIEGAFAALRESLKVSLSPMTSGALVA